MTNEFKHKLESIADLNHKDYLEIIALWQAYARQCGYYDQSPVLSEFCQWNKLEATESILLSI